MKKSALIAGIFLSSFMVSAQRPDPVLSALTAVRPTERTYIHYDKEFYVAGESIWFKAYLYSDGRPSGLSNNFYLQLIDANGAVITNKKYPVTGATVKGDIALSDSLPQGYYSIRALTPGMLNATTNFYYTKNLFIYNPLFKGASPATAVEKPQLSVQFFPESGYLVEGVLSVLAFKAVDSRGMPVELSGIIKMDDSIPLASFKTYHDGIGKVQIKPQAGKKYTAAISFNNQTNFFPLPEVQSSGINIKIEDEKGGKVFVLSRTKKDKDKFGRITMVAKMDNRVVYESEIDFESYLSVKGHLVTDSLLSGILQFTAFNKDGVPLAERLTFVDNKEYKTDAVINVEKKGLGPREENVLEIAFPAPIQRSCSVSITDIAGNSSASSNNIISSLLLTGDLKGYVLNPSWYFQNKNDSAQEALDNLMLTHGWSRYSRNDNGSVNNEPACTDSYLISITGFVKDSKTKETLSGGRLALFVESEDSVNQNFDIEIDNAGNFSIDSLLFRGKTKFYYAYTSAQGKEKTADLYFNQPRADSVVAALSSRFITGNLKDYAEHIQMDEDDLKRRYVPAPSKLEKVKELATVVLETKVSKRPVDEVNDQYTSGVFKSMGRSNFDNINEPENNKSLSVFDFIKRSVKQVTLQDENFVNKRNFSLFAPMTSERDAQKQKSLDSLMGTKGGSSPGDVSYLDKGERDAGKNYIVAIFLNESPAYVGILKSIRMDEVALIKYYEPGFIGAGGADGPGGAIAVYTKKNVVPQGQLDKLDHLVFNGYSITKEFYSPDYSLPATNTKPEDRRTTLYWSPELYTNSVTKSIRVRFFNNDFSKNLKIIFEGFDASGKLIHIEKDIE